MALLLLLLLLLSAAAERPEPYAWLHGGAFTGPAVPASVDPLVAYQWGPATDYDALQIHALPPRRVGASPPGSASNFSSLASAPYGSSTALLAGNATLLLDWQVEHAAWLEVALGALLPACASLAAQISESNAPKGPPQALTPAPGAPLLLRLETNAALYDGLRYAWLFATAAPGCAPIALAGVRAVAQALPLNYTGEFTSSDADLDRIWYTGAYSTRVNMLPGFLGSELRDRGDRAPPFQGDAHVAQSAALAAFLSPPLLRLALQMLNLTNSAARPVHDSSIATYPLMWVLSVADFFWASGDVGALEGFAPSAAAIVDAAAANFQSLTQPPTLRWSGWDDRLGSGFADVNHTAEARRLYWMVTLRASSALAKAAAAGGGPILTPLAAAAAATTATLAARLRNSSGSGSGQEWWQAYGVHARAAAALGGWLSAQERAGIFAGAFTDTATACSFSNYDSGFLLGAYGALGRVDYGTALLRLCWGEQLRAGASCWWEAGQGYGSALAGAGDMDALAGGTTSACHAWGSAPSAWLQRSVLGVAPTAPGFAAFAVAPGGLGPRSAAGALQAASGTVPTPRGPIRVQARVEEQEQEGGAAGAQQQRWRLTVAVLQQPAGTACALLLPARLAGGGGGALQPVLLRYAAAAGAEGRWGAWEEVSAATPAVTSEGLVAVDGGWVRAARAPAASSGQCGAAVGEYGQRAAPEAGEEAAAAAAPAPSPTPYPYAPFLPPVWSIPPLRIDNSTHGDWVGARGLHGYVLLGFDPQGASGSPPLDRARLPPFVASVSVSTPARADASSAAAPVALLADPASPGAQRRLGVAAVSEWYALWVDVVFGPSGLPAGGALVSLYVADTQGGGGAGGAGSSSWWPGEGLALRAEDLGTHAALAPEVVVRTRVAAPVVQGGGWDGNGTAGFNAGGLWGLERGVFVGAEAPRAGVRLRLYCVSGAAACAAGVSGVFFDPAA